MPAVQGTLTYSLLADGHEFYSSTVVLRDDEELEVYQTVDVEHLGSSGARQYSAHVTCNWTDGQESAFLMEVVRMSGAGRQRVLIGCLIFGVTFIGIISDFVHRVYASMIGASAMLAAIAAVQETLSLEEVVAMVDFDTTMLLFSMMVMMKMVQETGFFDWFSFKIVCMSRQDPRLLFYAMSILCGVLSMFLDNVTCVLLFGPLTYSLAKKMSLNPRPLYLSMTICATVGGTGTLIGDPPNIVLASKLKLGFMSFIYYNLPLIIVLLPFSAWFLWYRLRSTFVKGERVEVDLAQLELQSKIVDMPKLAHVSVIFGSVIIAFLLSPLHDIEPSWFTVMAMFGCGIIFKPNNIQHYLEHVEWDTLLFFAFLFVLVEGMSHLGVISMMADALIAMILAFPEGARIWFGIILCLWVGAFGSAFLESLPFTTAVAYILLDMQSGDEISGLDPQVLAWPLSVGICIGGIGSILGASANIVAVSISERYAETEDEIITGADFLRNGLPLMVLLMIISMVWQLLLFAVLKLPAAP